MAFNTIISSKYQTGIWTLNQMFRYVKGEISCDYLRKSARVSTLQKIPYTTKIQAKNNNFRQILKKAIKMVETSI